MGKKRSVSQPKTPMSLTDQIRAALETCGETRYRVAKNTGLNEPQLCRFAAGSGISFESLDKLAAYLGLEIVVRGKGND